MEDLLSDGDPLFVGNQEALAVRLGVDRKTIGRWEKKEDCPGRTKTGYDVKAWEAFVEKNNLGRKSKSKGKIELDNEKVALGNERMRLVNARLKGEVISQDEVIKVFHDLLQGFVLQLGASKHTIAEECVGLSKGEATKRIDRRHKEVLAEIALGSWAQKKTFWSKVSVALSDLHKTHGLGRGARTT